MPADRPLIYRTCQWIARTGWSRLAGLDVRGLENVPKKGAFLLIANHESNLDPILIQAVCPRGVHAMAKSSQFLVPVVGALVRSILAFPVRRYQVDPHAVRIALRRLGANQGVAVYIEGERSWDGRLQSARPGTVRLALKAGVPVLPCGISGSYEAWPRWSSKPQLLPIRITFGVPINLPRLDSRREREPAVAEATATIMGALERLSVAGTVGEAAPAS
jgi:1-acyl-sn-glycerol-3-phosphate acyltransferase